jgi:hypothetical protein
MAPKPCDKGMRDSSATKEDILSPIFNVVADTNTNLKIKLLPKIHNSTSEDIMHSIESYEFETVR